MNYCILMNSIKLWIIHLINLFMSMLFSFQSKHCKSIFVLVSDFFIFFFPEFYKHVLFVCNKANAFTTMPHMHIFKVQSTRQNTKLKLTLNNKHLSQNFFKMLLICILHFAIFFYFYYSFIDKTITLINLSFSMNYKFCLRFYSWKLLI